MQVDPEPSPSPPCCAEQQPEPTADGEPDPAATDEPSPSGVTVLRIAPELEPDLTSDQVQELATERVPVDEVRECEDLEESLAHCTTTEGEQILDSEDFIYSNSDLYADMPILLPPSSELPVCPEMSVCPVTTTEVVPLSAVLPVLGVAIWCVWAAWAAWAENPSAHKFTSTLPLLPPPVTHSPPSVQWDHCGSASLHWCRGWRIPCLRLQPLSPGLRLSPSTQWLHHGS